MSFLETAWVVMPGVRNWLVFGKESNLIEVEEPIEEKIWFKQKFFILFIPFLSTLKYDDCQTQILKTITKTKTKNSSLIKNLWKAFFGHNYLPRSNHGLVLRFNYAASSSSPSFDFLHYEMLFRPKQQKWAFSFSTHMTNGRIRL